MEELIKIDAIVNDINVELFNITKEEDIELWYESNGSRVIVRFCGMKLWDSENDDREYNEELDEYEDLEYYIRKEFNKISIRLPKVYVSKVYIK